MKNLLLYLGIFLAPFIVYLFFRLGGRGWYKSKQEVEKQNGEES